MGITAYKPVETYSTSDIALTAFLKTKGYAVLVYAKSEADKKVRFEFDKTEKLMQDVAEYYNNGPGSHVPARRFNAELQDTKAMLFNAPTVAN